MHNPWSPKTRTLAEGSRKKFQLILAREGHYAQSPVKAFLCVFCGMNEYTFACVHRQMYMPVENQQ